ncbi:MAG: bacteriohemerythrin [Gammaproteobacteria bacterium]|nr:bacteriohemerythrin [Gammaproteobacteria bacterium]
MSKLWNSDLETGIPEIDAENKKIVEYINVLSKAKDEGNRTELVNVLDLLLDHVCNQFLFEEHMMKEAGYEYSKAHEKVHELFAKKLADFRGRIKNGETFFDDVISMLDHWVDGHIRNEDQMYAETLQVKITQEGGESWVQGVMKKLFG